MCIFPYLCFLTTLFSVSSVLDALKFGAMMVYKTGKSSFHSPYCSPVTSKFNKYLFSK